MSLLTGKKYVITTYWTFPFGGGEAFMYDTMEWASELGMLVYWIAFATSTNQPFENLEIHKHQYGTIINIPGGLNVENLTNWFRILKPDIVHHQGSYRDKFFLAAEELNLEFMTGFHFWTGGIILGQPYGNIDILQHKEHHKIDPEFTYLQSKKNCHFYVASRFVQECFEQITNTYIPDIIFPASSTDLYKLNDWEPKYVVMVNIHHLKGGQIIYYLLQNCPNIPMLCVRTEHQSEELDKKIKEETDKRNNCVFMERTSDVKSIYRQAKVILVTSLVDETFCRVLNEAMMNGIVVLCTGKGNTKYLLGEDQKFFDIKKPEEWQTEIEKLYQDSDYYQERSQYMIDFYQNASETKARQQFKSVVSKVTESSKEMNIAIFTPWCDQGLGIQSRNYYRLLKTTNRYRIYIFALKPYNADTCRELQKNPDEWEVENIYYSPHNREEVTDQEMIQFVKENKIGKFLIPETCWVRVFQLAKLLREQSVKTYAIPNIEIVRKDELFKHGYFHKILANNYLCQNIFQKHLQIPIPYIGYAIDGFDFKTKEITDTIKYLFIGGMNAFSRKHILLVCEGFVTAYQKNQKISLTCTIQKTNSLEISLKQQIERYRDHPGITIISDHLPYSEVIAKYYTHHIVVQVSKHEGLGLGFYEAISTGTPVLTLDTPPHNEIIKEGINGWIVNCYHKKMEDNKDPLFDSAYFDPKVFSDKLLEITPQNYLPILETLKYDYDTRLSLPSFSERFMNAIRD